MRHQLTKAQKQAHNIPFIYPPNGYRILHWFEGKGKSIPSDHLFLRTYSFPSGPNRFWEPSYGQIGGAWENPTCIIAVRNFDKRKHLSS